MANWAVDYMTIPPPESEGLWPRIVRGATLGLGGTRRPAETWGETALEFAASIPTIAGISAVASPFAAAGARAIGVGGKALPIVSRLATGAAVGGAAGGAEAAGRDEAVLPGVARGAAMGGAAEAAFMGAGRLLRGPKVRASGAAGAPTGAPGAVGGAAAATAVEDTLANRVARFRELTQRDPSTKELSTLQKQKTSVEAEKLAARTAAFETELTGIKTRAAPAVEETVHRPTPGQPIPVGGIVSRAAPTAYSGELRTPPPVARALPSGVEQPAELAVTRQAYEGTRAAETARELAQRGPQDEKFWEYVGTEMARSRPSAAEIPLRKGMDLVESRGEGYMRVMQDQGTKRFYVHNALTGEVEPAAGLISAQGRAKALASEFGLPAERVSRAAEGLAPTFVKATSLRPPPRLGVEERAGLLRRGGTEARTKGAEEAAQGQRPFAEPIDPTPASHFDKTVDTLTGVPIATPKTPQALDAVLKAGNDIRRLPSEMEARIQSTSLPDPGRQNELISTAALLKANPEQLEKLLDVGTKAMDVMHLPPAPRSQQLEDLAKVIGMPMNEVMALVDKLKNVPPAHRQTTLIRLLRDMLTERGTPP